jgi:hypothetical protein
MNANSRSHLYDCVSDGVKRNLAFICETWDGFAMLAKAPKTGDDVGYAALEDALATVFGIDQARRGAFRARIQHLRRLGFFPEGPGRGKVVRYDFFEAARILFALELEAFGADPKAAVEFLAGNWKRAPGAERPVISISEQIASASQKDLFVTVHLDFLNQMNPIETGFNSPKGLQSVGSYLTQDDKALRYGVFNLSSRLRALRAALDRADQNPNDRAK